jgi:hypothetical protein
MGNRSNHRSAFRFSLKTLLILVVPISAGLAALRDATSPWLSGVVTVTLLAILGATLAAMFGSRSRRPILGSFAIYCGGYFFLVALSEETGIVSALATTKVNQFLLERFHPRIEDHFSTSPIPVVGRSENGEASKKVSGPRLACIDTRLGYTVHCLALGPLSAVAGMIEQDPGDSAESTATSAAPNESTDKETSEETAGNLLGAVEPPEIADNFLHIAQCLWAIALGAIGGLSALCFLDRADGQASIHHRHT